MPRNRQLLINAVTGQVKFAQRHLSGLGDEPGIALEQSHGARRYSEFRGAAISCFLQRKNDFCGDHSQ